MIVRLHVKGLSSTVTVEDLKQLFAKIGNVEDIHRPTNATATGQSKDFAIIRLETEETKSQQVIKSLNNTLWKGAKLRISKAKEYYKDRIQREKFEPPKEEKRAKVKKVSTGKQAIFQDLQSPYLKIRRARGLPIVRTSLNPLIYYGEKVYKYGEEKEKFTPKNKKTIFTEDFLSAIPSKYEEHSIIQSKQEVELPKTPIQEPKKVGKGVRRGFGSINQIDCCIENEELEASLAAKMVSDFISDSPVSGVCGEVTEEELKREQDRSLSIMQSLLQNPLTKFPIPEELADLKVKEPKKEKESKKKQNEIITKANKEIVVQQNHPDEATVEEPKFLPKFLSNTVDSMEKTAEVQHNKAGYVDMNAFHDIFKKSDGVWWNDERTNKENAADARGNITDDLIFREAEKQGFDIRSSSNPLQKISDEKKTFRLFSAEEEQPSVSNKRKIEEISNTKDETPFTLEFNVNLDDLWKEAKQFSRDRPENEIYNEWQNTRRDKLREFKKRHKDAIRNSRTKGKLLSKKST